MIVNNIKLEETEDGNLPSEVTVTMTIREALWVALISGKQQGSSPHESIYDSLHGDLFNRFWDGGAGEADDYLDVTIPPIEYKDNQNKESK